MENRFKQPDLFLVMDEDEMEEALTYAENLIGDNERTVEMYMNFSPESDIGQYKLSINNTDVRNFILDENNNYKFEFPMIPYYCLIFYEIKGKSDSIALALPVSLWPEAYDIDYIKSFFTSHNFKIKDYINKMYLNEALTSSIKPESEQARIKKLESPWTIRDQETLQGVLEPEGESSVIGNTQELESIVLIKNSNITLDFNAHVVVSSRFDTVKIDYSTFNFPNSLIVYTKDGQKTPIYIGGDVSLEEIIRILNEQHLTGFVITKDLNDHLENIDELLKELMPLARFKDNEPRKHI